MQYTLFDLLRPEHVLVDMTASDAPSAILQLNQLLVRTGHTTPDFADDACIRELSFPTGLPTQPLAVAIPHADPAHVESSAIAVGTLHSPVKFAQMGTDGSLLLDVSIVCLLAIKEQEKQVEMIQQLMKVIQNSLLLVAMVRACNPAEILELIHEALRT